MLQSPVTPTVKGILHNVVFDVIFQEEDVINTIQIIKKTVKPLTLSVVILTSGMPFVSANEQTTEQPIEQPIMQPGETSYNPECIFSPTKCKEGQ